MNNYKQNFDDVTCNIKKGIEIDVHSDAKHAVKRQVFKYDTNK